jgi:hypothetical protein
MTRGEASSRLYESCVNAGDDELHANDEEEEAEHTIDQ